MAASSYDSIAGMYDRFWRDWYFPAASPALERLFFRAVPSDSQVLDVCCGCGHVTAELVARGYRVTGMDLSPELIALARSHVPEAEFVVGDVRSFQMPVLFDAALSTFDAMNHMLTIEDLGKAFAAVASALKPHGCFVFDMNLEEAYSLDLRQWTGTVEEENVSLVRGTYDAVRRLAQTELLWFRRVDGDLWQRSESVVHERCYPKSEILDALLWSGFTKVCVYPARDVGVSADLGFGRIFISAQRKQD